MTHDLHDAIEVIERERDSTVLVFAASSLDLDLLPVLYDMVTEMNAPSRLDIVAHIRGGEIGAARRIAMMLSNACEHLTFVVPFRCESAGTIMALAAEEIIAGPAAIFSPIDPQLQAENTTLESGDASMSAEDVRRFPDVLRDWFGADHENAHECARSILAESIFPTTLTSFYRAVEETRSIGLELTAMRRDRLNDAEREKIVDGLLFDHHSHGFPLSGNDLAALGLPLSRQSTVEAAAWEISRRLSKIVGSGLRKTHQDDWFDTLLQSRHAGVKRRRSRESLEPQWEASEMVK